VRAFFALSNNNFDGAKSRLGGIWQIHASLPTGPKIVQDGVVEAFASAFNSGAVV
jgi:hypothetical protein